MSDLSKLIVCTPRLSEQWGEQSGWDLEATGKGGDNWTNFEKGGVGNIGGVRTPLRTMIST